MSTGCSPSRAPIIKKYKFKKGAWKSRLSATTLAASTWPVDTSLVRAMCSVRKGNSVEGSEPSRFNARRSQPPTSGA
eukprot:scaffold24189_cov72-Phaeocystis_antarctica.AAC.1